ncbi:MAG TPA: ABC transporter permease [Thermomicrobiales bacterium]|nr:ABC transporter permease [Thermomicrobiales bacterium]
MSVVQAHSSLLGLKERESRSFASIVRRRLARSYHAVAGATILGAIALAALFAPIVAPADPLAMTIEDQFQAPSGKHLFGTDEFGRDILTRVIYGARYSLRVGVLATLIAVGGGTLLGLTSGYFGGWIDGLGQKLIDVLLAFPGLLLALMIIAILGTGLQNVLLALGIGGIPYYARLMRGQVLSLKEREFVEAARVIGAGDTRIMLRHLFPNTLSPLIVVASIDLGANILAAAALSFIGLGAQPPTPEWGAMLSAGRDYMRDQWWIATFPGLAIVVTVLGFNLIGDGLRDALDPRGLE